MGKLLLDCPGNDDDDSGGGGGATRDGYDRYRRVGCDNQVWADDEEEEEEEREVSRPRSGAGPAGRLMLGYKGYSGL